jgi:hypothetical protein
MIRGAEGTAPPDLPRRIAEWPGTSRYRVRRCIGSGAVGAVYEAFDEERGALVAVKRLRDFSPVAFYNFKQEFRALADVDHPNLVRLYELIATEDREVFFTMELVRGEDIVTHVRGGEPSLGRLRDALRQLAEGVRALHAAGKLHRDIKPSNVLVTPEGRVVLLDFGVAVERGRAGDEDPDAAPFVGTPAYMAPEQVVGGELTPASDWYAVGALLYEALTGSVPFDGPVPNVLRLKVTNDAPRASAAAPAAPAELDALCAALLDRDPELRPDGEEILRLVAPSGSHPSGLWSRRTPDPGAPLKLVGRADALRALRQAFETTREGRAVMVNVRGPSGVGKTSLVRAFTDALASTLPDALVLRGRAYEHESVAYKAVDGWIDDLSRHLLRLGERGALPPLPADVGALARIFPVLRRVQAIADRPAPLVGDPHRARRDGFAALRELLASLAARQPVVVHMDDVHWGDEDSASLLLELVRPPQSPPLLLVMTFRAEEGRKSALLDALRASWPRGAELREIAVGPLEPEDASRLALELLDTKIDPEMARVAAAAAARESGGSPFLIEELVRGISDRDRAGAELPLITLERSVADRARRLPAEARVLLDVVAVGGRPLPVKVLCAAAGVDEGEQAMHRLREARFVRSGLRGGRETAETVNDRIRDVLVAGLSAERTKELSLRLARALEATPDADADAIALQLAGAGEKQRAAAYAERGAERAVATFAFDRAAQLLRLACEGTAQGSPDLRRLRERLADALALAGRGVEAAREYLALSEGERGARRVGLERAAAEQLLASGRIDEGGRVLHRVLAAIGTSAPATTLALLFWLFAYQVRLVMAGLRFSPRAAASVRAEDRERLEAMYAVALGFAVVDVLLGAYMQARFLLAALRLGDPDPILRAAALEATQLAAMGRAPGRRERALLEVAQRLADSSGRVEAQAFVEGTRGVALFLRGRWKDARTALDASHAKLPGGRNQWNANTLLFAVRSLYFAGDLRELARRQAQILADARDRGDLYTVVNLAATTTMTVHLAVGDPEGARREAQAGMAQWSQTGFLVQHFQAMAFEPDVDLYLGDGEAAYRRVTRDLPALRGSLLLRVQFIRGIFHYVRGRCAAAAAFARPDRRRARVAEGMRAARALEREGMPWTAPLAAIVRAASENAAGRREAAIAALRSAADAADVAGMRMHAEAARFRLGGLLGGQEGATITDAAREVIEGEGVRDVERWVAIYLPGVWPSASQGAETRARPVTAT